jgi:hypothetical protein
MSRTILRMLPALVVALALARCGSIPGSPSGGTGDIVARIRIVKLTQPALSKAAARGATVWDSLVVVVSGADMSTVRRAIGLDMSVPIATDTVHDVPAGSDRTVDAFTKSASGDTVHTATPQVVDLEAGEILVVDLRLVPSCGSIYIELLDVPTSVDSVFAWFVNTGGDTVGQVRSARSSKLFLSIDYVPDATQGTVTIAAVDALGDTLYQSEIALTFYADQNASLSAPFAESPGGLGLDVEIEQPGITLIAGTMASGDTVGQETGPLVISEIMYAANDSEYIELYNPQAYDTTFDTLIVQIDGGTPRYFENVTVNSLDFFVIGRRSLPWADTFHTTASALDLSSTTGNWIALLKKDLTVIDWVAFAAGTNSVGWPKVSGKTSVVLDSVDVDQAYNNFGTNWCAAVSEIDPGITAQLGTPGLSGS